MELIICLAAAGGVCWAGNCWQFADSPGDTILFWGQDRMAGQLKRVPESRGVISHMCPPSWSCLVSELVPAVCSDLHPCVCIANVVPISGAGMWTLRDITHFTWAAKQLADVELMAFGYYQPDLDFNPEVKEFISLSLPIPLSPALGIPSAYPGRWCKTFPLSLKPVLRVSLFCFDVNLPPLVCVILQDRLDDPWEMRVWAQTCSWNPEILESRRALCECGVAQALSCSLLRAVMGNLSWISVIPVIPLSNRDCRGWWDLGSGISPFSVLMAGYCALKPWKMCNCRLRVFLLVLSQCWRMAWQVLFCGFAGVI